MNNARRLSEDMVGFSGGNIQTPGSIDVASCIFLVRTNNPITTFEKRFREVVISADPSTMDETFTGNLLLVNLVSHVESYVKSVISSLLKVCPISLQCACSNNKNINLASILWGGENYLNYAGFENDSIASEKNIIKAIHSFLDINIDKDEDIKPILKEFEKICQMRHGIVHCSGILSPKNAIILQIPRPPQYEYSKIQIKYQEFQNILSITAALVRSINKKLMEEFCWRWVSEWRSRNDWNNDDAVNIFRSLFSILYLGDVSGTNYETALEQSLSELNDKVTQMNG